MTDPTYRPYEVTYQVVGDYIANGHWQRYHSPTGSWEWAHQTRDNLHQRADYKNLTVDALVKLRVPAALGKVDGDIEFRAVSTDDESEFDIPTRVRALTLTCNELLARVAELEDTLREVLQ